MPSRPTDDGAPAGCHGDALERMLARLATQRACIDFAVQRIAALPGPVLEVGLGKGRTYDRIRRLLPDRQILVFDREVHCPPDLRPPQEELFLGDFRDTLAAACKRLKRVAAMVHADIGSKDHERDARLARDIGLLIDALVRPDGIVLSDRRLPLAGEDWTALPLPPDAARTGWPYFIWMRLR